MGDQDRNREGMDDKTRLLARKADARRPSLLRDAINAVDAALGSGRKGKRAEVTPVQEAVPVQNVQVQDVRGIEYQSSQEIIEQALIEMKSDIEEVEAQPLDVQDNHPLQGKIDPGRTRRVRKTPKGERPEFHQEPVVAWLVIVQGPGLGAFKAVFEGNNSIGRASTQHIQIDFGDDMISAEEQAFIRYDPHDRSFLFVPNMAKTNVVSVNEKKPTSAVELSSMDVISMGQTRLAFVPFCGDGFDWSDI